MSNRGTEDCNTWLVLAFDSPAARDEYVRAVPGSTARAIAREEVVRYASTGRPAANCWGIVPDKRCVFGEAGVPAGYVGRVEAVSPGDHRYETAPEVQHASAGERGSPMTPLEARQRLGLSQAQFARLLGGTSPMTVSKWETGQRVPQGQAAELMRLLVWLHDHHPAVYTGWCGSSS